jgi:protein TonB
MFDATLQVPRLQRPALVRGAIFSFAAHAAVLALVLRAHGHAPPKRVEATEVTLRLVPPPPPPPPPLGGAQGVKTIETKKPTIVKKDSYVPRDPMKPPSVPDPAPAATAAGEPGGKEGGVPGGKEGGQEGGILGGTGTALPSAQPPPPPPSFTVLPFGEGMNRPQRVAGPEPDYPRQAREAKVEGTMLVKCVITTSGTLRGCRIIKSLPFLDQPVLEALAQQRYTPVTFQGRPVDVEYVIPFKFKLQ